MAYAVVVVGALSLVPLLDTYQTDMLDVQISISRWSVGENRSRIGD